MKGNPNWSVEIVGDRSLLLGSGINVVASSRPGLVLMAKELSGDSAEEVVELLTSPETGGATLVDDGLDGILSGVWLPLFSLK